MAVFGLLSNAQDVKSQTEELASIKKGNYTAYLTHKNGEEYIGGLEDLDFVVTKVEDYKIQTGAHKTLHFIKGGSRERPDKQTASTYMPDNEAFPITYAQRVFEGNAELQKEIGYVQRINKQDDGNRLVFLDTRIYLLENFVDKDDYTLKAVLEFEEKPLKTFQAIKVVMKSPKKMKALQPHEKLQAYLDAATQKQKAVYADWIKVPANKALIDNQKAKTELMNKTITQMSKDWRNSEEYKRIQENNRRADRVSSQSTVTVQNKTGRDIYVFVEGSRNGTPVRSNSSGGFDCKKNLYYSSSSNSNVNGNGIRFYSANQSCGGTVNVD